MGSRPRFRNEAVSWVIAAAVFAAAAIFGAAELSGRLYMNELIARNDAERTINLMLSIARAARAADEDRRFSPLVRPPRMPREGPAPEDEAQDFAAALETHPGLKERIVSIAAYGADGKAMFRYGAAPELLTGMPGKDDQEGSPYRAYRFDGTNGSLRILHPFPIFRARGEEAKRNRGPLQEYRTGAFLLYELKEKDYFNRNAAAVVVFIVWLAAAAAAILTIRRLVVKNRAYRETLRNQKELVALGTAARTLAHEIKNPLSAIQLQADLVGRLCPGAADKQLEGISEETARIRLLVDRIGDFLREPKGEPTRIDLAAFAAEVLARAGENGEPVPVRAERSGIDVVADAPRLRSVIENIARNAFDSGSPAKDVEAHVREEGQTAVLEILDRGKGIPDGIETENLFDPFFTTKTKGFGLGLSLSRRFVEAAGGTLTLRSREGGGAAARVTIPKAHA